MGDDAVEQSFPHGPAPTTAAVDRLVMWARAGLVRVEPEDLAAELAAGALVVDTRPVEQRMRDGVLPGAVVVDRNVLEWRLDPTSPHRLPEVTGPDHRVIVVCDEGFSSSLAAATLRRLGLDRATDLVGGYQGWRAASGGAGAAGGGGLSPHAAAVVGEPDGATGAVQMGQQGQHDAAARAEQ